MCLRRHGRNFRLKRLNINALDALFNMITKRYDLIFIDHPLTWFSWTAASHRRVRWCGCHRDQYDSVLATDIGNVGSSSIERFAGAARSRSCSIGASALSSASVARRKHVHRVLHDERVFFVSSWPEAVESVNMGVPMMLGASAGKLQNECRPLGGFLC